MLTAPLRPSAHRAELLADRARGMRRFPTPSEMLLWKELRGGRLGVRFVRQAPIGPFIVDFLAPAVRLVVEVDGGYHQRKKRQDARRDEKLGRWGYRVVRIEAVVVMQRMTAALALVSCALGHA